jgi:hypothetical protein
VILASGIVPLPDCNGTGEAEAMGTGTGSTLVVNPEGLTALTMGLEGGEPAAGSTPYIVPLQSLNLNEALRWQFVYDTAPPGEGGERIDEYGPLVPLSFWVVIKSTTRAGMIGAYKDLEEAATNRRGGTIQYKPEDVGASVLSTYYHYVASPPPELLNRPGNRWDAGAKADGMYTIIVGVTFMTQPVATSDPDNPETLTELSDTLENWYDASESQDNTVTVSATNVKGSMPALLRLIAQPGSGQNLARLIVHKRDEGGLTNFMSVYEAEDAAQIYPAVSWINTSDTARGDDAYMRCVPATAANGVAQGLRFTISSPDDHEGRFAVFGVGYEETDLVDGTEVWTHQVKVRVGNIIQTGKDTWYATSLNNWQLIYAGEFELPPAPQSDAASGYDVGPYVEWYATRNSGSSAFRLDAIILVYVADSDLQPTALDVWCDDEHGVTNSERLLIENFPDEYGRVRELAQVLNASSEYLRAPTTAPRGDFLTLSPNKDTLLCFVQEEWNGELLDDDCEGYEANRWYQISDFDTTSDWTADSMADREADTTNYVEGTQAVRLYDSGTSGTYMYMIGTFDLTEEGRFGNDDYIVMSVYLPSAANDLWLRFWTSTGNYYRRHQTGPYAAGWHTLAFLRSDFGQVGSPDWSDINRVYLGVDDDALSPDATFDYLRFEVADPDDATNPNPTGNVWDFQPTGGAWAITEDVGGGAGATLACLDIESGVEKVALIDDDDTPADVRFRARVRAKRDEGYVGIVWRAGPDTLTEGTEDCYAAVLDTANDQVLVREYNNGAVTQKDAIAMVVSPNEWFIIGVIAKGSTFQVYVVPEVLVSDDDDIFDEANLRFTVTDATHTTGKCGVMSISTLGRFDEAKLWSLRDKVAPSDTITLTGTAIFRTIAPFYE